MNKPTAIVYTSNTGYTQRYAKMLGEKTGLRVYSLKDIKSLEKGTVIIYLGWLFASSVKGYNKAKKRFDISAVVGIGLGDTGSQIEQVRKAIALDETIPLFTVQGGMDNDKLRGMNKFMIKMLTKSMSAKAERSDDENRMLDLIINGGDYVSEDNLSDVLNWWKNLG